jgi:hypothetical protein
MDNRTAELDRLMRDNNMTARQVGCLIGRTPKTVRNWRGSVGRTIPAQALDLLRTKIAAGVQA